jgi:peptidoglycan-associated lipoprotein
MKVKTLGMMLIIACQLVTPTSQAQPLDNKAMSYYCGNEDVEFKEQVTVGLATRVHLQDGAFYLVQETALYEPMIGLINEELQSAGLSKACADYLLSKGELNTGNRNAVIARVFFKFDSSQLTDSAKYILDNIVALLTQNDKTITLIGHTDNSGNEKYNFSLGLKRSKEVEAYLVDKGIDPAQLSSTSNGPSQPLNANANTAERQANRRVEIIK